MMDFLTPANLIQIVAYAVLTTAVVVSTRLEGKANRDSLAQLSQWMTDHEKRELADIDKLRASVDQAIKNNSDAHATIAQELGRLAGKIDNGDLMKRK